MATTTIRQEAVPAAELPATSEIASGLGARPISNGRKRVIVLGSGVAGLTAAYELRRGLGERADILLISDHDQFVLGPGLLAVPFGQSISKIGFAVTPALARHNIGFWKATVEHVDPQRRIVRANGQEIAYDYLLIATGPAIDTIAVPGVGGEFNASYSIYSETSAMETRQALERFLKKPGPAVVGLAPGASYLSAAYEFALWLDYTLRRRGIRDQASITFVTPEAHLGHLGVGIQNAQRLLERSFARREIAVITGHDIQRVDLDQVYLRGGRGLPATFTMVMPAFHGVPDIWKSSELTDVHGYIPVDAQYRHRSFPEIYAAGVAAQADVPAPRVGGLPKTGYLAAAMARIAARNIAAAITRSLPSERSLPHLLDMRILDGGDTGVLLVSADIVWPLRLALSLPGRSAHRMKGLLARYLLWKLRTGRTYLP
jgi:sulfide:quinone oxidoreductase